MTKLEWVAWIADFFVLYSAWLTAHKNFPLVYYVSMCSALLFGTYAYINKATPLIALDITLFCMYSYGLWKHDGGNSISSWYAKRHSKSNEEGY